MVIKDRINLISRYQNIFLFFSLCAQGKGLSGVEGAELFAWGRIFSVCVAVKVFCVPRNCVKCRSCAPLPPACTPCTLQKLRQCWHRKTLKAHTHCQSRGRGCPGGVKWCESKIKSSRDVLRVRCVPVCRSVCGVCGCVCVYACVCALCFVPAPLCMCVCACVCAWRVPK